MQDAIRKIDRYQAGIWLTILAGILLRTGHLLFIDHDEPYRFGGLFYEFSLQILRSGFVLPDTIPYYSAGGLPFAYPPLAFYVQALLIALFHPPRFVLVNLLPPLVAAMSVPSFYYLARQLFPGRLEAWSALAAFAFMPNAFLEQVEGAGLPEAFGQLALIWYAAALVRTRRGTGWRGVLLAGFLLGLSVLSSPGSAVGAGILTLVFGAWSLSKALKERLPQLLFIPGTIALVGLLVSAPYWTAVMGNHGAGIFLASFTNQFVTGQSWTFLDYLADHLLRFDFSSLRNNSFLWSGLTFWGLVTALNGSWFYLPLLFVLFFFLPREGVWLSALVASLLAGRALAMLIRSVRESSPAPLAQGLLAGAFVLAAFSGAVEASAGMLRDKQAQLEAGEIQELEEQRELIPQDAKVIVWGNQAFQEWAPLLLEREVINIPYGLEWQPGELPRVERFNQALYRAGTFEEIKRAVRRYFRLEEVYLVTSGLDRIAQLTSMPVPVTGVEPVGPGDKDIVILHLVMEE